ncbi:hypothetical protein JCM18750_18170 [Halostagnicola bangensis]
MARAGGPLERTTVLDEREPQLLDERRPAGLETERRRIRYCLEDGFGYRNSDFPGPLRIDISLIRSTNRMEVTLHE